MFAYCLNNPINLSDETGAWAQWVLDLFDFFASNEPEINKTGNYKGSEYTCQVAYGTSEIEFGGKGEADASSEYGSLSFATNVSVISFTGKMLARKETDMPMASYGYASADVLTVSGDMGFNYKKGVGIFASAKAAVASGTVGMSFDIYGWEVVIGLTGDIGSIGAELQCGIVDGTACWKTNASLGIGGGFIIEVTPPQ